MMTFQLPPALPTAKCRSAKAGLSVNILLLLLSLLLSESYPANPLCHPPEF